MPLILMMRFHFDHFRLNCDQVGSLGGAARSVAIRLDAIVGGADEGPVSSCVTVFPVISGGR